jgi:hypothetical protein
MNRCHCQSRPERADGGSWRKWFSGSTFAAAGDARRCSGFVHIAITDNAIAARRRQHRADNRRYQQSQEGRLDHRDRQHQYRERFCRPRVTDQSSLSVTSPTPSSCETRSRRFRPRVSAPRPSAHSTLPLSWLRYTSPSNLPIRYGVRIPPGRSAPRCLPGTGTLFGSISLGSPLACWRR